MQDFVCEHVVLSAPELQRGHRGVAIPARYHPHQHQPVHSCRVSGHAETILRKPLCKTLAAGRRCSSCLCWVSVLACAHAQGATTPRVSHVCPPFPFVVKPPTATEATYATSLQVHDEAVPVTPSGRSHQLTSIRVCKSIIASWSGTLADSCPTNCAAATASSRSELLEMLPRSRMACAVENHRLSNARGRSCMCDDRTDSR